MSSLSGARPTKGFLIEMKRRVSFIERGCEFLKLKRDQLAKELSVSIDVLRGRRGTLEDQLRRIYDLVVSAYLSLGPAEVGSQASSIRKELAIDVLPVSVMGVLYPRIRVQSKPRVEGRLDIALSRAAELASEIMEELIQIAEFEARVERIADELGKTNRKVNALENIVIPDYKQTMKFIEDKLDEEALEELVRIKLIGGALARRRE